MEMIVNIGLEDGDEDIDLKGEDMKVSNHIYFQAKFRGSPSPLTDAIEGNSIHRSPSSGLYDEKGASLDAYPCRTGFKILHLDHALEEMSIMAFFIAQNVKNFLSRFCLGEMTNPIVMPDDVLSILYFFFLSESS